VPFGRRRKAAAEGRLAEANCEWLAKADVAVTTNIARLLPK
jgi:hypothetical protein